MAREEERVIILVRLELIELLDEFGKEVRGARPWHGRQRAIGVWGWAFDGSGMDRSFRGSEETVAARFC